MTGETSAPLGPAIAPLAIAQTIVWASFYYSFPALMPEWEADLGWSKAGISGAFTASLLVAALLAPTAGGLIDKGKRNLVFLGGPALGAVLLAALSMATSAWQFYAIWICLGVVMAACLYEACFSILTRMLGARARQAITIVTLVAGFAGTVSFPSAHFLVEAFGWRGAVMVFAGAVILVALPLNLIGLRRLQAMSVEPAKGTETPGAGRRALRSPAFWLLSICFASIGLAHGAIISHIRPILADRDMVEGVAVLAASMIGPMQVLGRIVKVLAGRHIDDFGATKGCVISIGCGCFALLWATGSAPLVILFVVLHGAGYGIASIVRPVVTAEFLGREGFGVVSGMIGLQVMLGFAIGPICAALLWELGGYDLVLWLAVLLAFGGLVALQFARRFRPV